MANNKCIVKPIKKPCASFFEKVEENWVLTGTSPQFEQGVKLNKKVIFITTYFMFLCFSS